MDDDNLQAILRNSIKRQFWVKQWGSKGQNETDHESLRRNGQYWTTPRIEITFAKSMGPPAVQEGDILCVHLVRMPYMANPSLVCVVEALSSPSKATSEEVEAEPLRQRWPWRMSARNLTPNFGSRWLQYTLNPYSLAEEYINRNPSELVTLRGKNLRALTFGMTVLRVQEGFARFVISQILRLR